MTNARCHDRFGEILEGGPREFGDFWARFGDGVSCTFQTELHRPECYTPDIHLPRDERSSAIDPLQSKAWLALDDCVRAAPLHAAYILPATLAAHFAYFFLPFVTLTGRSRSTASTRKAVPSNPCNTAKPPRTDGGIPL